MPSGGFGGGECLLGIGGRPPDRRGGSGDYHHGARECGHGDPAGIQRDGGRGARQPGLCPGGIPVVIPRLSWAERRRRHRGISHHTLTALKIAALAPACLPLPAALPPGRLKLLLARLSREGLLRRHRWQLCPVPPLERILESFGLEQPTTMGRSFPGRSGFFSWRREPPGWLP